MSPGNPNKSALKRLIIHNCEKLKEAVLIQAHAGGHD